MNAMKTQPKVKKLKRKLELERKEREKETEKLKEYNQLKLELANERAEEAERRAEEFRKSLRDLVNVEYTMSPTDNTCYATAELNIRSCNTMPISFDMRVPSEAEKDLIEEQLAHEIAISLVKNGLIHLEYPDRDDDCDARRAFYERQSKLIRARVDVVPWYHIARAKRTVEVRHVPYGMCEMTINR